MQMILKKFFILISIIFFVLIFLYFYIYHPKQFLLYIAETKKNLPEIYKSEVSITFAGDVMLGRLVGHRHQKDNFSTLFENFNTQIFKNSDIAWLNLEGPISDTIVEQDLSSEDLNFLFSYESLNALKHLQINLVGLANNHTFNSGNEGLELTQSLLEKTGINWHGLPTKVNDESVYRFEKDDIRVSLIAVHTLYNGSEFGIDEIIRSEKNKGYFVIVLPHWGEEYMTKHSIRQEEYAKNWSNSGASIIIGTHPHVVQDAQVIKNKEGRNTLVFYSLGNFIFDQMFSEETQLGLILKIDLDLENSTNIKLHPVESIDLKPQNADDVKSQIIINRVCENIKFYCDLNNGVIDIKL